MASSLNLQTDNSNKDHNINFNANINTVNINNLNIPNMERPRLEPQTTNSINEDDNNCNNEENNYNTTHNTQHVHGNNLNPSMKKAIIFMKVIIRLTTLVGMILLTNILVIISLGLWRINDNGIVGSLVIMSYIFDRIVNSICLLYQFGFSQQYYIKYCHICDHGIKRVLLYLTQKRINLK